MSLFARSDSSGLNFINKEDESSEVGAPQQRGQLRLNVNQNDRNDKKSLLYQALFLPDKMQKGTRQTCVTSSSNSIITTALISPPVKRSPVFVHSGDRWTTSQSLSSSTDSLVVNAHTSQSSDSVLCNSSSNSPASGSKSHLHHNTSSDTFGTVSIEVDQHNIDDLCPDGEDRLTEESLKAESSVSYQEMPPVSTPGNAFQILNNQCFEAAITEGISHPTNNKYISKVKSSKSQVLGYKVVQTVLAPQINQRNKSHSHQHHRRHNRMSNQEEKLTSKPEASSSSDFIVPNSPSLSVCRGDSPKSNSSGGSLEVTGQSGHKQYRYNQTFSALQQSGLMKTTMKTAELLRRSRSLQQELAKLRRDTTLFFECVLNNPQNKDFKALYERGKLIKDGKTTTKTVSTKVVS